MSRLSNFVEPVGSVVGSMIGSGIVQVVNRTISNQFSSIVYTSDSKVGSNGEFDVTITPKFDNSIIKVEVRWVGEGSANFDTVFNIHKNGVRLNNSSTGASSGLTMATITFHNNNDSTPEILNLSTIDSGEVKAGVPITYSLVASKHPGQGDITLYTNRCYGGITEGYEIGVSEITVTEIKLNTNTDDLVTELPYPKVGVETLTHKRHPSNGKPVYTQVFYTNIGTTYDGTITTNIPNYEYLSVSDFVAYRPDGISFSASASYFSSDSSELLLYISNSDIKYTISDNSNWNNAELFVTVEYTKTTDTDTSPVAGFIAPVLPAAAIPYPKVGVETLTHKRNPVNGKPVYTRAYTLNIGTTYDGTINLGLTGIEKVSVESFALYTPSGITLTGDYSYHLHDGGEYLVLTNTSDITYQFADSPGSDNADLYVVVEYTKVSDTPYSPVAGMEIPIISTAAIPYAKLNVETLTHKRHPITEKPVYTKAFYLNIGTTYDGTIATNITNSENVYITEFVAYRPDGIVFTQASSYYNGDTSEIRTYINNNNIIYNTSDNSNWNNSDLYVFVEYTKTTDTAESPIAGLPAKEKGEILQVAVSSVAVSTPYDFTEDLTVISLDFTPKSDNSTLIFEFSCNTFRSSTSDQTKFVIFDGTTSTVMGNVSSSANEGASQNIRASLDNTNTATRTYAIKATDVIGTVQNYSGSTVLTVTEILN